MDDLPLPFHEPHLQYGLSCAYGLRAEHCRARRQQHGAVREELLSPAGSEEDRSSSPANLIVLA